MMDVQIILTEDQSLATSYRDNNFAGYLTSLPVGPIPQKVLDWFFPYPTKDKEVLATPSLSLRVLESIIHSQLPQQLDPNDNLTVKCIHPLHLSNNVTEGSVVLLTVMDPYGIGPATSSWRFIKAGMAFHMHTFWKLIDALAQIKKKNINFTVIVGGAGAWQLKGLGKRRNESTRGRRNSWVIDHIFLGEAEKDFVPFLCGLLKEKATHKDTPYAITGRDAEITDITPILGPSNLGMLEITRGCGRMCSFCSPTTSGKIRSIPYETIRENAETFLKHGQKSIVFQSEDTLRWDSKDFNINEESIYHLYSSLFERGVKRIYLTHATFSEFASQPDFIDKFSRLLHKNGHKYYGVQPGLESGSTRLMKKLMPGKFLPRSTSDWQEIVLDALKTMYRNRWVPTCSVILGIPGETKADLMQTDILVEKMIRGNYFFIFAPLLFVSVPGTNLSNETSPQFQSLTGLQMRIYKKMWKFNFPLMDKVWNVYSTNGYTFPPWKKRIIHWASNRISGFF